MSTAQKLQKDTLDNDNFEALKVLEVIKQFHIVVEYEVDGTVLSANENFLKVMGYTSEELKGAHHRRFFSNEHVENLTYRIFLDKLNRGESDTGESKMLSKNGREVWFNGSYCPVKDEAGHVVKVVYTAVDISATREELQVRSAIMDITSIVSESDLKGNILTINQKFCDTSQYSKEELLGKAHNTTRHPDMPKEVFKQLWATIGRGEFFRGVVKNRKKDGTPYYVDAVIAPFIGNNGKPRKYLGVRYDITEAELERQNMRGIIAAIDASFAYVEFDTQGNILKANTNFQSAMGYQSEEIVGRHHRMFVESAYSNSAEYAQFWSDLNSGKSISKVFKRKTKGGVDLWLQAIYSPVINEAKQIIKIVNIGINITNQIKVEESVNQMANEFSLNAKLIAEKSVGVAAGAQALGATTEEMNASIEELTASINSIAQNSKNTDAIAKSTSKEAEVGAKAITKAIEAMELISKSSEDISEIVKVIGEIAGQTNLLAFNAAIEAARAGEHGLGFSVVADEVRKLAERSSQATKEISKLINESVKRITQGSEISKQAGEAFEKIVTGVSKTTEAISEVSCAAEEQLAAAKEISAAIQQVADETEKSAEASDSIANSTNDLTKGAEDLKKAISNLRA